LDVVIDDGSHASFDQQLTLLEFFPLLEKGGWYFIQALDWQPPGEDNERIALTKNVASRNPTARFDTIRRPVGAQRARRRNAGNPVF